MATHVMGFLGLLMSSWLSCANAQDIQRPASFIVNGAGAPAGRYPYFVSLQYLTTTGKNKSNSFSPFCGASLISDRLVLTAAHCPGDPSFTPYYSAALPSDFKKLGFSFTALQNTYLFENGLKMAAFIGATSRAINGSGNPILAWFIHPYFDPTNLYYDIAVGLLQNPVPTNQLVKLYNPPGDIYAHLPSSVSITAIGLGDLYNKDYGLIEGSLNSSFVDVSNRTQTNRLLQETSIGTTTSRVLCGQVLTADQQVNETNGSGNYQFGKIATTVGPGQMCVGQASDAAVNARIQQQAAQIVASAGKLPPPVISSLTSDGLDPTSLPSVEEIIPGYNDTCQGDSGSPIILKGASSDGSGDVQIGTTSYGYGCGSGLSSIYTSVGAFLNATIFDAFLMNVLAAVPNQNGKSTNYVTSLAGLQLTG